MRVIILALLALLFSSSCKKENRDSDQLKEWTFEFSEDTQGWNAAFSDYPAGEEEFYELEFKRAPLPAPLDQNIQALKISGNNHSDDLLSYIYRKFEGLEPNRLYSVKFDLTLASAVATNSFGVGGSPDLALGAGGLSYEPKNSLDSYHYYRPNFQVLIQGRQSNEVMKVLGRIGVTDTTTQFTIINRNNLSDPIKLRSNAKGELWLLIGTDSGFESTTTLYYQTIKVKME